MRAFAVLAACIGLCASFPVHAQESSKVSQADATRLYKSYARAHGSERWQKMLLKEIKPAEQQVVSRLNAQMFEEIGIDPYGGQVILIRDGKVFPLGQAFLGYRLGAMAVTDLDGDHIPELVYSYSSGSGILRSYIRVLYGGDLSNETTVTQLTGAEVALKKIDDKTINVSAREMSELPHKWKMIGRLIAKPQDKEHAFVLAPKP